MKKLALLGVGAGLVGGVLLMTRASHAADHLDSPATQGNPMADIGDVFAWNTPDDSKVNLAMTVSPIDDGTRHFDKSIQYVWHVTSHPGTTVLTAFPAPGTETNVICTFTADNAAQCWVAQGTTVKDYVTGDPSGAGVKSSDGKLMVFAGTRSDPFYFNLGGFKLAVGAVEQAEVAAGSAGLPGDAAGCPTLDGPTVAALDGLLSTAPGSDVPVTPTASCLAGQIDCFAGLNVKAIVVQVDKTLLLPDPNPNGDFLLSVWASTYAALQ
ncbi:MAG TPA: DUF4331 family protein [Kofleriaceae bacterium]